MQPDIETTRNIVGIIGNVISFCLFLSPTPTFIKIKRRKSTEEFKPDPYLATLMNCMLWVFYGVIHPNSTLVFTINAIGIVMEFIFLSIYFRYANSKQRSRVLIILAIELVFEGVVIALAVTLLHTTKKRSEVVGILCQIFCIGMYVAPLTVMKKVIRTKSVKYMPFSLSLANFLNGICWTIYSLLKFDLNIFVPNGLGTLLGLIQLVLYATYYRKNASDDHNLGRPAPNEIQLS